MRLRALLWAAARFSSAQYDFEVAEHAAVGSVIGELSAQDSDRGPNGQLVYEFSDGEADGILALSSSGVLTALSVFDYEDQASPRLGPFGVTVVDGYGATATTAVVVTVTNVNDHAPQFSQPVFEFRIAENAQPQSGVGRVVAYDSDGDDGLVYATADQANTLFTSRFVVDGDTGQVSVRGGMDAAALDVDCASCVSEYVGEVVVTDGDNDGRATVIVRVSDVSDHPPVVAPLDAVNVSTVADIGTFVAQAEATDADATAGAVQFAVVGGNALGHFVVDVDSGVVRTAAALDYDSANSYALQIVATDSSGEHRCLWDRAFYCRFCASAWARNRER